MSGRNFEVLLTPIEELSVSGGFLMTAAILNNRDPSRIPKFSLATRVRSSMTFVKTTVKFFKCLVACQIAHNFITRA